jgi:hypothetical protein
VLGEIDMARTLSIYWEVMVGLTSWVAVGSDEMLDLSFTGPGDRLILWLVDPFEFMHM